MDLINQAKYRSVIIYGLSLAVLLVLLKWLEWQFIVANYALENYVGCIALLFMGLGIWLAFKLIHPKIITVEKQIIINRSEFVLNESALVQLSLSRRELEVLQLMAKGLSNQQIGEKLFISLNTVKTHSSRLFEKLNVQRRTQAVEKAKRLNLIP